MVSYPALREKVANSQQPNVAEWLPHLEREPVPLPDVRKVAWRERAVYTGRMVYQGFAIFLLLVTQLPQFAPPRERVPDPPGRLLERLESEKPTETDSDLQTLPMMPVWQPATLAHKPGETHVFVRKNGPELRGTIDFKDERKGLYRIRVDRVWGRDTHTQTVNKSELAEPPRKERGYERQKRYEQEASEAGYRLVEGAEGRLLLVPEREFQLANRAREMALEIEQPEPPDEIAPASSGDPQSAPPSTAP